jgi:hypothetical protein
MTMMTRYLTSLNLRTKTKRKGLSALFYFNFFTSWQPSFSSVCPGLQGLFTWGLIAGAAASFLAGAFLGASAALTWNANNAKERIKYFILVGAYSRLITIQG